VHTSAPAPIGSRRDVHKSTHAKYRSGSNIGVLQNDQQERWGQCSLRYPPTAELKPWHQVQGGVVDRETRLGGLGRWPDRSCGESARWRKCHVIKTSDLLLVHVSLKFIVCAW